MIAQFPGLVQAHNTNGRAKLVLWAHTPLHYIIFDLIYCV